MNSHRQYYLLALLLALVLHGSIIPFTLWKTYDAYVHIFFASHYAENWFDVWNYQWYTGFTMTSYPPLVHQIIALLSNLVGLKGGFIVWTLIAICLFVRGVYHFSMIWVSPQAAAFAALFAVISSSYLEAVHIFGQLPSITGIALLLNACPELYKWIRYRKWFHFLVGIAILACVTTAHHVSTIFGMVFFVAPVLGVAVLDLCIEEKGGIDKVRILDFINKTFRLSPLAILLGVSIIALTVFMIFPYWYWSKTDPIIQVSIPHGSRASFIEEPSLGLVFFLIPWGILLFFLPAIFHKIFHKRNLFLGLSFSLAFVLGTGGTTPIPIMILGENAFNILTLDRFTQWASIISLPFFGQLIYSFSQGNLGTFLKEKIGRTGHRLVIIFFVLVSLSIAGLVINFGNFKPIQPKTIDVDPIVSFMQRDGHDRWRYMTLGFGDQMAWLSANTSALSVDGNYHSARRLPELTSRAVERIENSKYLGEEGLGALRDFLTDPEKYHLKYVFSNDKFYEPLLFFYGWTKLKALENNVDVWERKDIPPLPTILPMKDIPRIQKLMWGTLPLTSLTLAAFLSLLSSLRRKKQEGITGEVTTEYNSSKVWYGIYFLWMVLLISFLIYKGVKWKQGQNYHKDRKELINAYFHALDFKRFDEAYSYLDKSKNLSIDQYNLELSLEGGILASYAKLDSIVIKKIHDRNDSISIADVEASWFTATQKYTTSHEIKLTQADDQWYIVKDDFEAQLPPEQFINIPDVNFFNQGRRKAEVDATDREDVLDRPEMYVDQTNLVFKNDRYYVVGELTNIDDVPAYVTVDVQLYDEKGEIAISAHTNEVIIHNLLPKERTSFRVDIPTAVDSVDLISGFAVFVRSTVTDEKLYKYFGLRNIEVNNGVIKGEFDNYGNREVTVPQVLLSFFDNGQLVWVDSDYLDVSIRPQRLNEFQIAYPKLSEVNVLFRGTEESIIINGSLVSNKKILLPGSASLYKESRTPEVSYHIQPNGFVSF